MKLKNMRWRTRGALVGFALPALLMLAAIAIPRDGSISGNVSGFCAELVGAPASWLVALSAPHLPWGELIVVELVVFWAVFGGIIGLALESRPPRRQQILIGAALYLGFCYYDYFVAVHPPAGMLFSGGPVRYSLDLPPGR